MAISERASSKLAFSPLTQVLARHLPIRGGKRLVFEGYLRTPAASRPRPTSTMSIFGDSFHIDFNSWLEWQVWAFGTYEKELGEFLATILRPGDTALDIGANFGVHSIRMAKLVGPSGRVIVIEPAPSLAQRLKDNISLNSLENMEVIEAAVTDRSGDVAILYEPPPNETNRGRASLLGHDYLTGESYEVNTVAIDDLTCGPIRLIKIDVEGGENDVLIGAKKTIESQRPIIVFEFNMDFIQSRESSLDYFRSFDYDLSVMDTIRNRVTGLSKLQLTKVDFIPKGNVNIIAIPR